VFTKIVPLLGACSMVILGGCGPVLIVTAATRRSGDSRPQPVTPRASTTVPAADARGVSTRISVFAVFNQALDPASVNSDTFHLTLLPSATRVPAQVVYEAERTTVRLTPATPLLPASTYRAELTDAVRSLAGRPLDAGVVWTFVTLSPATPIRYTPPPTAVDVLHTTAFEIQFDRPIDESSLSSGGVAVERVEANGNVQLPIATTTTAGRTVVRIAPPAGMRWPPRATLRVSLDGRLRDVEDVPVADTRYILAIAPAPVARHVFPLGPALADNGPSPVLLDTVPGPAGIAGLTVDGVAAERLGETSRWRATLPLDGVTRSLHIGLVDSQGLAWTQPGPDLASTERIDGPIAVAATPSGDLALVDGTMSSFRARANRLLFLRPGRARFRVADLPQGVQAIHPIGANSIVVQSGGLQRIDLTTGASTQITQQTSATDLCVDPQTNDVVCIERGPTATDHRVIVVSPTGSIRQLSRGGLLEDPSGIATDTNGDVLVSCRGSPRGSLERRQFVLRLSRNNGAQALFSGILDEPNNILRGSGSLFFPAHLDYARGMLYVADTNWGEPGVERVAAVPASGDRNTLTGWGQGNGPALRRVWDIAWREAVGELVVADPMSAAVFAVAPASGNRTAAVIDLFGSQGRAPADMLDLSWDEQRNQLLVCSDGIWAFDPSVGTRSSITSALYGSLAWHPDGRLLVGHGTTVTALDLGTRQSTTIASVLGFIADMASDRSGSQLWVTTFDAGEYQWRLYHLDLTTGVPSILYQGGPGPMQITHDPAFGLLLAGDGILYRWNPVTRSLEVFSAAGTGSGPSFGRLLALATRPGLAYALSADGLFEFLPNGDRRRVCPLDYVAGAHSTQDGYDSTVEVHASGLQPTADGTFFVLRGNAVLLVDGQTGAELLLYR